MPAVLLPARPGRAALWANRRTSFSLPVRQAVQFSRRRDAYLFHPLGQGVDIAGGILSLPGRCLFRRKFVLFFFAFTADARRRIMAQTCPPGSARGGSRLILAGPLELEDDQGQDDDGQERCQQRGELRPENKGQHQADEDDDAKFHMEAVSRLEALRRFKET